MRARVPYSHGAWPSLWAKSSPTHHEENVGWGAEVDIFEVFSSCIRIYINTDMIKVLTTIFKAPHLRAMDIRLQTEPILMIIIYTALSGQRII